MTAPVPLGSEWQSNTLCAGVDIITAEMMTLAHDLALGRKTKYDVVDDMYNRRSFRDKDGLPDWFLDDESRHDKVQRPVTKAAADAIKEKLRLLNARPIKKVREAQARKKFKAAQKLEKLKKKSELLMADEGMTEKEKGDSISKMLHKASKKKPHIPKKVVVARGSNRAIKGRYVALPLCYLSVLFCFVWPLTNSLLQAQGCPRQIQDCGPADEEGYQRTEARGPKGQQKEIRRCIGATMYWVYRFIATSTVYLPELTFSILVIWSHWFMSQIRALSSSFVF